MDICSYLFKKAKRKTIVPFILCLLLTACGGSGSVVVKPTPTPQPPTYSSNTGTSVPYPTDSTKDIYHCTYQSYYPSCLTPHALRVAYSIEPLTEKGFTGKGQTVVLIESFGSSTLQKDVDFFDKQFDLPPITVQQIDPIHEPQSGSNNDRVGWAGETTGDVEIIHAIAPDAKIVVLVSPVDETEGTVGLPEFRQLIQYTIDHKLGYIISESWGASEATLKDATGQTEVQKWDALYKQATTQDAMTILAASGDNGATDYSNLQATQLATTPTVSFPIDDPWVTSAGGTSLRFDGTTFSETSDHESGGGLSAFFPEPVYQQQLPASVQHLLHKQRGIPDVSANADGVNPLAIYVQGQWSLGTGTSVAAPLWAGLIAIANQMVGHPLGFINPALYKLAASSHYEQDFHDITTGNNSVDGSNVVNQSGLSIPGYNAVPGWDAVTSLGSPDAVHLLPDLIAAESG